MTAFDYFVIAVLLGSMALGFMRGVVGEVLTLAAWILAFLVARKYGVQLGEQFLQSALSDSNVRALSGWALTFVGVLLAMSLLRLTLKGLLRAVGMGGFDRVLGLAFGLVRGGLLLLALVAVAGMTPLPSQSWWKSAQLSPYLEHAVLIAAPWLPDEVNSRIRFN